MRANSILMICLMLLCYSGFVHAEKEIKTLTHYVSIEGEQGVRFRYLNAQNQKPTSVKLIIKDSEGNQILVINKPRVSVKRSLKGPPRKKGLWVTVTTPLLDLDQLLQIQVKTTRRSDLPGSSAKLIKSSAMVWIDNSSALAATENFELGVALENNQVSLEAVNPNEYQCFYVAGTPGIYFDNLSSCAPLIRRESFCSRHAELAYRLVRIADGSPLPVKKVSFSWVDSSILRKPGVPSSGAYVGLRPDLNQASIVELNNKYNFHFAIAAFSTDLTYLGDLSGLNGKIEDLRNAGVTPLINFTLNQGLDFIDLDRFREFACYLGSKQIPIFLQPGNEMNAPWYPWGQKPALYRETYQAMADIVHGEARNVAMVWAPNNSAGYPFYERSDLSAADRAILDTSKNGILDASDEPYAPYYPGDAYVDWVGVSATHVGANGQFYQNVSPEAQEWSVLHGRYGVFQGISSFAALHSKPVMISETGAFYTPHEGGGSEIAIKSEWMKQVFNLSDPNIYSLTTDLPNIKALIWIDDQDDKGSGKVVRWGFSHSPALLKTFQQHMLSPYFIRQDLSLLN